MCAEGSESVHVHHQVPKNLGLKRCSVEIFKIFLANMIENIWLKIVERKMSQRKMNEQLEVTP